MIQQRAIVHIGRSRILAIGETSEIIVKYLAVSGNSVHEAESETESEDEIDLDNELVFPNNLSCMIVKCLLNSIKPSIPMADI